MYQPERETLTRRELEAKWESFGTSVEREKRAFVEKVLAQQWLRQQGKLEDDLVYDVEPEQMLAYYREHAAEFEQPARARWEQLTVKKSPGRSREEAYATLAAMGNQVLDGQPFAEVARRHSEGPTAARGGLRDWTTPHSLVSSVLDQALFTLPVGVLSPILEDEQGFHIIRVLERQEASRMPFEEAQVQIREKLLEARRTAKMNEYLAKLREEIPVWTAFDGSKPERGLAERPRTLPR